MSVKASVIVPTYNRRDSLLRLLEALGREHAAFPAFDVVVADDGSTDGTADALNSIATPYALQAVRQPNGGPGAARNAALQVASGDVAIFLDDDVVPQAGLIEGHVAAHRGRRNAVVLGAMEPHESALTPWAAWELRTIKRSYDDMSSGAWAPTPRQFFTANASVRREHLLTAGGFNESMRRAEDVELAYRLQDAGCQFEFHRELRVWHEPRRTFAQWLDIARQYGHYDVVMWRDLGREHILRNVSQEYPSRNGAIRAMARLLVGRPALMGLLAPVTRAAALVTYRGGARSASMGVLSLAFNLEYWNAIARELGGRARFWHAIEHPDPEPIAIGDGAGQRERHAVEA